MDLKNRRIIYNEKNGSAGQFDGRSEPRETRIKICGITNSADALLSIKLGADELGFNFYDKSPRFVTPENAAAIIDDLPENISKIGVFVNESFEQICETATAAGLNAIQLHGDEDAGFIDELHGGLRLPLIKAVRIAPGMTAAEIPHFNTEAILLDTYAKGERGGTGETFDWTVAKEASRKIEQMYLAGGLSPDNVKIAILNVRPFAVDVCSSIESKPGKKDPEKLAQFIEAVRGI